MRSRQHLARDSASGLITALCLFYADQAVAADDPFALPYDISAASTKDRFGGVAPADFDNIAPPQYALFAEIRVNGLARKRLVQLHDIDGRLSINAQDAEAAGLIEKARGDAYLDLDSLKLLKWHFDRSSGILSVDIARKSDGPNNINLATGRAFSADSRPLTAFIGNYDLTAAVDRNGVSVAGLLETRMVRGDLSVGSGWRFASNNPSGQPDFVRLDSALTLNMPERAMSTTLGDFISTGPASARAVRLGGFRIGTDFGLRPDLITYPLPDFTGSVAVPTGLDLVVADRRFKAGEVEAGEFTVRNIPVPVGRNSVGVVVRDFLGQERVDSVEFYTSRQLLAKGLTQYSINVGATRRNFGRLSNDYGGWAATGHLRQGISNNLTVEPAVELAKGYASVGMSSTFTIGAFGLVSLDARASRFDAKDSVPALPIKRRGKLFGASFESIGKLASVRLEARKVGENFDDLASVSGDRPPPSFISASLNLDLNSIGNFRLTAIRQTKQRRAVSIGEARRSDIVTASYRKSFRRGINLFVDATHQRAERRSNSILFGLSAQFGARANGQVNVSKQGGQTQLNAGLYRLDALPGEVGYALTGGTGTIDQAGALLAYRAEWGRVEAQAELVGKHAAARVGASGSLLLADSHIFASRRLDNGFALVRTGKVANVGIEQENRPAGKSGGTGRKLLTDFPAYVPTRISIDPKSLPDMAVARKLSAMVVVPARSGSLIDLDVEHYQPALFRLVQADGRQIAPGTVVQALPSKSEYIVGFDSMVEINGWHDDSELRFQSDDGRTCFASFSTSSLKRFSNDNGDTPEVRCDGSIRPIAFAK